MSATATGPAQSHAARRWWVIVSLLLLAVSAAAVWYVVAVFVPQERSAAIEVWRGRLSAMADDRKAAITAWLDERRGDAKVVAEDLTALYRLSGQRTEPYLFPPEEGPRRHVQRLLDSMQGAYGYRAAYVLDAGGNVVVDSTGSPPLEPACRASVARVLSSGHPEADFHAHADGLPVLAITTPVRVADRTLGAVLLSVDPARWLYPLLLSEPIPTRTAESLLARQVGDQIEFLSPLRHNAALPLSFRVPMGIAPVAAAAAIRGEEDFKQYVDYRGVRVLGAARRIPNTGWGLVVKVDQDEALAGFRRSVRDSALALAGLLLALAGLGFGVWRTQAASYRAHVGESDARFAILRKHANDAILFASRDGVILDVNRKAEEFYVRRREELLGLPFDDLRAPEERAALRDRVDALARDDELVFEAIHRLPDGTRFPVEVSIRVTEIRGQDVLVSIVRDMTERKNAEEALRESEDRFRYVFEHAILGKSLTRPTGEIQVNRAFAEMLGYSLAEMNAKKWQEISHPDDVAETERMIASLMSGERESARWTKRYIHKNGSVVWADVATSLRRDQTGAPLYLMTSVSDITERNRAEQALRESEARYRTLVDTSPDGITLADPKGKLILCNQQTARLHGFENPQAMRGINVSELIAPEDRQRAAQNGQETLEVGSITNIEYTMLRKDGSRFMAELSTSIRRDANDAPVAFVSITRDITERKRAEEEIRRLNAELEERVQQRTAQLEAANKELEAFSYSVSHDLRAPLRAIDGFSRIVIDDYGDRLDDEGKRQLDVIRSNTQKMGRLIDDLLAFSRAGRAELHRTRITMSRLAHSAFSEVASSPLERERIDLSVGELPDAWADPALMRQVWVNLLSNAVKFSRPRERAVIHVTGALEDARVVYHVRDNGVGFAMQYADKLFGVFQRLHTSREFEGTGVGLALVQRIVHRHGGEVWAEGVVDSGATFSFALPREGSHEQR